MSRKDFKEPSLLIAPNHFLEILYSFLVEATDYFPATGFVSKAFTLGQ